MQGEAKRYGWKWLVAQVEKGGAVHLLDPKRASTRGGVTLTERAALENALDWFDAR